VRPQWPGGDGARGGVKRQRRAARRAVQHRGRVRERVGAGVREPECACMGKVGSRDVRGRVREQC
jgi:hypothetical protein